MKNFIFKSKNKFSDFHKINVKLDIILTEQRHQRSDLAHIIRHMSDITSVPASEETENIPEEEQ